MDLLIAAIALYLFVFEIDYDNMAWIDKIYAASFGIWIILLGIRCYIYKTGQSGKNSGRKRD